MTMMMMNIIVGTRMKQDIEISPSWLDLNQIYDYV